MREKVPVRGGPIRPPGWRSHFAFEAGCRAPGPNLMVSAGAGMGLESPVIVPWTGLEAALRHYHLLEATLGDFYRRTRDLARRAVPRSGPAESLFPLRSRTPRPPPGACRDAAKLLPGTPGFSEGRSCLR